MTHPTGGAARLNRRVIHGELSQIAGRSWSHALFWLVLALAAGVDVVTFYQVLILVLNVPEELVMVAVAGFAAVALTLAHYTGLQARQAINPRNITGSRTLALLAGGTWLVLGVTAFAVRLVLEPAMNDVGTSQIVVDGVPAQNVGGSSGSGEYLGALLFLALYLSTGVVTGLAGYFRQDPAARQYGRAVELRSTAAAKYAHSNRAYAQADQVWKAIQRARERHDEALQHMNGQFAAAAGRLRAEAQVVIAQTRAPLGRARPFGQLYGAAAPGPGEATHRIMPGPGGPPRPREAEPEEPLPPGEADGPPRPPRADTDEPEEAQ
jgi:hypothetical protein